MAVDYQVCGERNGTAMPANLMFADPRGQLDFVRVGARSGNPVGMVFVRILKAKLNMI